MFEVLLLIGLLTAGVSQLLPEETQIQTAGKTNVMKNRRESDKELRSALNQQQIGKRTDRRAALSPRKRLAKKKQIRVSIPQEIG